MSSIKWHRDDHERIFGLLHNLTLEEAGAELIIRALIVSNVNRLPDDDRFLAGFLRLSVRRWRQIKQRLFEVGALFNENGFIRAPGLTDQINEIEKKIEKKRVPAAVQGSPVARKRASVPIRPMTWRQQTFPLPSQQPIKRFRVRLSLL
ncbi:MAG TPA: hypothetical protein VN723_12990 [Rhizomicrobium sp.]|nr:hypothetical protein [Rhizomicrobium sp.]